VPTSDRAFTPDPGVPPRWRYPGFARSGVGEGIIAHVISLIREVRGEISYGAGRVYSTRLTQNCASRVSRASVLLQQAYIASGQVVLPTARSRISVYVYFSKDAICEMRV